MKATIVDCGPLVAFYSTRDHHHGWAFQQMSSLRPPLLCCEPVITEACFLLHRNGGSAATILRAVREGILKIAIQVSAEASALETLMKRYVDTPMSLADACLVRLSELHPDSRIFTLDSDFNQYRRNSRQVIPLLAPWS